jgi:hypothetical protein
MFLKIFFLCLMLEGFNQYRIKIQTCQKSLLETYNFTSNLVGKRQKVFLCPKLKLNCCSLYEQFNMYITWKDKIEPRLKNYQKGFAKKTFILHKMIEFIFKMDVPKMIRKLRIPLKKKEFLILRFKMLKTKKLDTMLFSYISKQYKINEYFMKVRSSFFCNICDFQNQPFFDIKKQILSIDEGTCGDIVENTIEYSYFSNSILAKQMILLSQILNSLSSDEFQAPLDINNFRRLSTNIRKCYRVFKNGFPTVGPCYEYCNYYNFNSHSPFIEGNHEFFNNALSIFARFIKENYNERTHKELKIDRLPRFLAEKNNKAPKIPEGSKKEDPYAEMYHHPEMNISNLRQMFEYQDLHDLDQKENFIKFVQNRLHYYDGSVDLAYPDPDGNPEQIFDTSKPIIVNLANFKTFTDSDGADIQKHFDNRFDQPIKDLISHIKHHSKYRLTFEALDQKLLEQINEITNADVQSFHQDNFVDFIDLTPERVKKHIMNNYELERKQAIKSGYNIK